MEEIPYSTNFHKIWRRGGSGPYKKLLDLEKATPTFSTMRCYQE